MRLQPFFVQVDWLVLVFWGWFYVFSAWLGVFTIFIVFPFVLFSSFEQKSVQILSFSCVHLYVLDCSYFPLIFAFVSKITGVRPLWLFKKSVFEWKTPDKGIGVKNANIVFGRNTVKFIGFRCIFGRSKSFFGLFSWLFMASPSFGKGSGFVRDVAWRQRLYHMGGDFIPHGRWTLHHKGQDFVHKGQDFVHKGQDFVPHDSKTVPNEQ